MGELKLLLAYVLPVALVIWFWFGATSIPLKITATLLLPLFYALQWSGLGDLKGWPVEDKLPEQFQLLAADIIDPVLTGDSGRIHLWVRLSETGAPRSYLLPYSKPLHQQIHTARQKIQQGRQQQGIIRENNQSSAGAEIDRGRTLEFEDLPRRRLPPKKHL